MNKNYTYDNMVKLMKMPSTAFFFWTISVNKLPICPVNGKKGSWSQCFSPGDKPVICASLLCLWPTLLCALVS